MAKRNLYLETIPVEEAAEKYSAAMKSLLKPSFEKIAVTDSLHRIMRIATVTEYKTQFHKGLTFSFDMYCCSTFYIFYLPHGTVLFLMPI